MLINETIIFNSEGGMINVHNKGFNNRPVVVFEIEDKTYYLKLRGSDPKKFKFPFEIEIDKEKDDLNNNLKKSSWVDCSNLEIMETLKFKQYYKDKNLSHLVDLPDYKQLEIVSALFINLMSKQLTIQEIDFNQDFKVFSTMIKRKDSNHIFNRKKYDIYKNLLEKNLSEFILLKSNTQVNSKDNVLSQVANVIQNQINVDKKLIKNFRIMYIEEENEK